jgi:hypothetical protein
MCSTTRKQARHKFGYKTTRSRYLGGAVGSEGQSSSCSVGGFLSGFARGGNAVMQQNQQRQQEAQANARKKQAISLEERRAPNEHQLHQASTAHLLAETVSVHHLQEAHDQEAVDKKNIAARLYSKILTDRADRGLLLAAAITVRLDVCAGLHRVRSCGEPERTARRHQKLGPRAGSTTSWRNWNSRRGRRASFVFPSYATR